MTAPAPHCLVIGAGPAGLAAALAAARAGRSVLVLEKNDRPGRKLLLTGGGRCNLTDPGRPAVEFLEAFGRSGRFLRQALAAFDLAAFLASLGVETEGGEVPGSGFRVPGSGATERRAGGSPQLETRNPEPGTRSPVYVKGGAGRFLDALLAECARRGVRIETGAAVESARRRDSGGFEVETSRGAFSSSAQLVIASGGITYSSTGSTGDGYRLAGAFGHEIEPPRSALGALATDPCFPELAGISVEDAEIALLAGGKKAAARTRGALLLTHAGISGPAALDMSLEMARLFAAETRKTTADSRAADERRLTQMDLGTRPAAPANPEASAADGGPKPSSASLGVLCGETRLLVDLAPALSREELVAGMVARARAETKRTLENAGLSGLPVPARLSAELARRSGLDPGRRMGSLSERDFGNLAGAAKALALAVTAPPKAREAMVTVGGVSTKNLDPRTLESRLVPGLRFAGELLSPAGPCGGYNLLMAFATGTAAGG